MQRLFLGVVLALLLASVEVSGRNLYNYNPKGNPKSTYINGNVRFQVLTSQLIRIEYSPNPAQFEDRASITMMNRYLPPPPKLSVAQNGTTFTISTGKLVIKYNAALSGGIPSNTSMRVSIDGGKFEWLGGQLVSPGNLLGTVRTLDTINGSIQLDCAKQPRWDLFCTYGLVSRDGWSLIDDTQRPLYDGQSTWDWVVPRPNNPGYTDWYLLAHGHEYRQALFDFTLVAQPIQLPPRSTFGIFWSRYWAYNDLGEKEIVREYEIHKVPLDVVVIDMDWHITEYKQAYEGKKDQASQTPGWTGYTWDAHLFPEPKEFLAWLHNKGLKVTLNIHPASGVQPHELYYPEMATAMGINPATRKYVPFNITDQKYATNLMNIMFAPLQDQGVDFWWLDYQQDESGNPNPTYWLNYVFTSNFARINSANRPVILHRWGGLGNHKFYWGFSGDVVPSWASLKFQPYFTTTAANVGYMWSHDIGGHTLPTPPELYTRWVQWGAFSPVFRTHATKQAFNERRIWAYPLPNFLIMRNYVDLRSRLMPYMYTEAQVTSVSGLAWIYPLYYDFAEREEAYSYKDQYMFGQLFFVAPILDPVDPITQEATKTFWLPPGTWIEWNSGHEFAGDAVITRTYTLSEMPVFVRAGAVVPMLPDARQMLGGAMAQYAALNLKVFVSTNVNEGDYSVYEDDGDGMNYEAQHSFAEFYYEMTASTIQFTIFGCTSKYSSQPTARTYTVEFVNVFSPSSVQLFNGATYTPIKNKREDSTGNHWYYAGNELTLKVVITDQLPLATTYSLNIAFSPAVTNPSLLANGFTRCIARLEQLKDLLDSNFPTIFQQDYFNFLNATEFGQVLSAYSSNTPSLISSFSTQLLPMAIGDVQNLSANMNQQNKAQALSWLKNCL